MCETELPQIFLLDNRLRDKKRSGGHIALKASQKVIKTRNETEKILTCSLYTNKNYFWMQCNYYATNFPVVILGTL